MVLLDASGKNNVESFLTVRIFFIIEPALPDAAWHANNFDILFRVLQGEALAAEVVIHRIDNFGNQVLCGGESDADSVFFEEVVGIVALERSHALTLVEFVIITPEGHLSYHCHILLEHLLGDFGTTPAFCPMTLLTVSKSWHS